MTKPSKWHLRPAKTQINLGIRPDWAESSLSVWRKLGSLDSQWAHSKDSDQTGRMPSLIWVFAERTSILLVLSCAGSDAIWRLYNKATIAVLFTSNRMNVVRDNKWSEVGTSSVTNTLQHLSWTDNGWCLSILLGFSCAGSNEIQSDPCHLATVQ